MTASRKDNRNQQPSLLTPQHRPEALILLRLLNLIRQRLDKAFDERVAEEKYPLPNRDLSTPFWHVISESSIYVQSSAKPFVIGAQSGAEPRLLDNFTAQP